MRGGGEKGGKGGGKGKEGERKKEKGKKESEKTSLNKGKSEKGECEMTGEWERLLTSRENRQKDCSAHRRVEGQKKLVRNREGGEIEKRLKRELLRGRERHRGEACNHSSHLGIAKKKRYGRDSGGVRNFTLAPGLAHLQCR